MKILWLPLLILAALPAQAGKVKMCLDDACSKQVKREKLDCTIHKNKHRFLKVGFKMSVAFAAKAGPEVTFGRSTEINWGKMSQELIRRYEELCDFHNKGHLSVSEFNRRHEKLESYFEKAKDLKEEIEETVAGRAAKAFDDLDAEARKHSGGGSEVAAVKEKIKKLTSDVDELSKDVSAVEGEGKESSAGSPSGRDG